MGFWDQEEIEAALGDDLATAIPELLRLAELHVRIAQMEVIALEHVAAHDGRRPARCSGARRCAGVAGVNDSISLDVAWISVDRGTPSIDFAATFVGFNALSSDLAARPADFDRGRLNFGSISVDRATTCCVIDSAYCECDGCIVHCDSLERRNIIGLHRP